MCIVYVQCNSSLELQQLHGFVMFGLFQSTSNRNKYWPCFCLKDPKAGNPVKPVIVIQGKKSTTKLMHIVLTFLVCMQCNGYNLCIIHVL